MTPTTTPAVNQQPTFSPSGGAIIPQNSGPSSPISVAGMQTPQTAVNVPQQPSVNTGFDINNSIMPISAATAPEAQNTNAENQQSDILNKVSSLMENKQSLATLQTGQEQQAGVFDMQKTLNDLNVQLQGLNDKATMLQNAAAPGGEIQNQEQLNATGRGITSGGLSPITASDLRKNQIQQASIAAQSLTLKSAIFAQQGNLNLAKAAADRAAQVQFDAVQQQLDYENSLLQAIQPQLTRDQKAQADQVQANLADRQKQIDLQIENYKTGQAAIADALKNNPGNPQAQKAAQEAAQLDPHDPTYLQQITQLVGQFGTDITKRALDQQLAKAQINEANLNSQKLALDIQNLKGAGVNIGSNNLVTTVDGKQYIDGSNISGTDATMVQRWAAANNLPFVGKDQAETLQNVANAQLNQTDIINQIKNLLPKDSSGHILADATVPLSKIFQTNDQMAAYGSWRTAAINSLKATAGSKGLRINKAEIEAAVTNDIPNLTDTLGTAQQKFNNINTLLQNAQDSILVKNKQQLFNNSTEPTDRSKGATWIRPDGTYVSDGTQWVKKQ